MTIKSILITGVAGELGTAILPKLIETGSHIVTLDLNPPTSGRISGVDYLQGDICDRDFLNQLFREYSFHTVFHFAALLSSASEKNPFLAQKVNVEATNYLIQLCYELGKERSKPVKFLFPSSIAAYGSTKSSSLAGALSEEECLQPQTIYGLQKLFVEQFGSYLFRRCSGAYLDFRSLRFPGLISMATLPTGGTSDYAAEMIHSAHKGSPYSCFVSENSTLPFMTMPDAVRAILGLAQTASNSLQRRVYNVRGFSVSALQLANKVIEYFPNAQIAFDPIEWRDAVIASWPNDICDKAAQVDWNWKPEHELDLAFSDYFIPELNKK